MNVSGLDWVFIAILWLIIIALVILFAHERFR